MESEMYITALGIATMVGFLGCLVEMLHLKRRIIQLEDNQEKFVQITRGQLTNMNSIAGSVQQINRMRQHWLGLVK